MIIFILHFPAQWRVSLELNRTPPTKPKQRYSYMSFLLYLANKSHHKILLASPFAHMYQPPTCKTTYHEPFLVDWSSKRPQRIRDRKAKETLAPFWEVVRPALSRWQQSHCHLQVNSRPSTFEHSFLIYLLVDFYEIEYLICCTIFWNIKL